MKYDDEVRSIIPCNNGAQFAQVFIDKTKENKVSVDFTPIIAWKVIYQENSYVDSSAWAYPILAEPIDNLKEGVIYYPDTDFWHSPGNFSGSGKEKLVEIMITNYLNNEGYGPAGIYSYTG